ncbi:uncharacterized protein [Dermacentor albipictus]|uniref:uncharacterized protein n=1 Tax=Dermacentor albipictus TaxID=60249 RepID=UPI0038FC4FFB
MVICAVVGCSNRTCWAKSTNTNFFRLPKIIGHQGDRTRELSAKRRGLWLARIKRADLNTERTGIRVCGAHFVKGRPSKLWQEADPDWAPTLLLGYSAKRGDPRRHARAAKRRNQARAAQARHAAEAAEATNPDDLTASQLPAPRTDDEVGVEDGEKGIVVQTDMTMGDLEALEKECVSLNERLYAARNENKLLELREDALKCSDRKVAYYTGMANFTILYALFGVIERFVSHNAKNSLPKFQEFLLFIMKLKLNLQITDLAFRFNVSDATVSRIFDKWLHAAYCRLKSQIVWPQRSALQRTMPQAFYDSFGENVAVIVDCFEIKIERPSSFLPRSETWSQYKGSNTAKYLIGIAPQGIVNFISEGWGGRTSDRHITEHCGLLDNLLPGDVVLADRGFNVSESVGFYCAKLHVPAYTKGKKQLSAADVLSTRKLANVRIHVERVIGLIRNKYVILKATLPIDYVVGRPGDNLTPLDKIVTVCCALSNLCPSIVASLRECNGD